MLLSFFYGLLVLLFSDVDEHLLKRHVLNLVRLDPITGEVSIDLIEELLEPERHVVW